LCKSSKGPTQGVRGLAIGGAILGEVRAEIELCKLIRNSIS